ncbi:hypothetical protein Avbf_11259 [Armadillidium vulgare]|nr:hypothetical protein Avbf_11259 [Armadillidium vulgare]
MVIFLFCEKLLQIPKMVLKCCDKLNSRIGMFRIFYCNCYKSELPKYILKCCDNLEFGVWNVSDIFTCNCYKSGPTDKENFIFWHHFINSHVSFCEKITSKFQNRSLNVLIIEIPGLNVSDFLIITLINRNNGQRIKSSLSVRSDL